MTRRIRRLAGWAGGVLVWQAAGAVLVACPICFQMEEGPVTSGVRAAVVVLIAVTCTVLAGFAAFIVRFTPLRGPRTGVEPRARLSVRVWLGAFARTRPVPQTAQSVENRHDPHD